MAQTMSFCLRGSHIWHIPAYYSFIDAAMITTVAAEDGAVNKLYYLDYLLHKATEMCQTSEIILRHRYTISFVKIICRK